MDPKRKDNLTDVSEVVPAVELVDEDADSGQVMGSDGKPITLGNDVYALIALAVAVEAASKDLLTVDRTLSLLKKL